MNATDGTRQHELTGGNNNEYLPTWQQQPRTRHHSNLIT
jgi:hypothetical protein